MTNEEFIKNIAEAVQRYAGDYGIAVHSPVIAQACLESGFGTSNKAKYHNYFGLKYRANRVTCHSGYFSDSGSEQNKDGSYTPINTDWYKFDSLKMGVLGYFQFINISRYSNLKGITNPREYLEKIKEDEYATQDDYVERVMRVINTYNLTQYDRKEEEENNMSKIKVHIDPGHQTNHYNQSTTNKNYYESNMTWKLANYLKAELENRGIIVTLSRNSINENPSLYNRGYAAKGCNMFLSLHSNACESNKAVDYPVVYRGYDKVGADGFALNLARLIQETMGTKQSGRTATRRGSSGGEYYGVMRGAREAGLTYYYIVEHSFHTNAKATEWLLNDNNLRVLARKEADLIASFFNVKNETKPTTQTTTKELYRVRKSWSDSGSQVGAYSNLENAKNACKSGYYVFDSKGNIVYPIQQNDSYLVQITADVLNVRKGPATSYKVVAQVKKNQVYTIIKESGDWGFLKSKIGWINLNYTKKK